MNRRFNIAMVAACPFPYQRGTPIRILRLAEALSRKGHDVHVVTYHLGDEAGEVPFRIHRIPKIRTYRKCSPGPTYQKLLVVNTFLANKLSHVLKNHKIDLVHAHHYEGLLVSTLVRKGKKHPLVYDAHTLLESELPYYGLGLPRRAKTEIGRFFDRSMPKWANHIITVTDEIKTKLVHHARISPMDVTVAMNGIEWESFEVNTEGSQFFKKKGKTLVFAGSFAPYQGIELLLSAFQHVRTRRQDVRLLIISDSPFDQFENMAAQLNIREHIDFIPSEFNTLPMHLAGADIALHPRVACDGIPQKLLNYMAAGKAIVSFQSSAKTIEHGRTGWIVEDGDLSAFAEAILQLLDDDLHARKLGAQAKDHAQKEYSWEKTAEKVEMVYEKVCRERE